MRRVKFLFLIVGCAWLILGSAWHYAWAQPLSSTELVDNAKQYDNAAVVYEGEVVGEVMARGRYAWINLNDGHNAIGIWVEKDLLQDIIQYTGNYKTKGDWLEVSGVFHRACVEHGGDLDIHAQALRKTHLGRYKQEKLNINKRNMSVVLLGVLCLTLILQLFKTR